MQKGDRRRRAGRFNVEVLGLGNEERVRELREDRGEEAKRGVGG